MTKKFPTSEDSELFRDCIGKVRAIKQDKILPDPQAKPKPYPAKKKTQAMANAQAEEIVTSVGREDVLAFAASGIAKDVLKKLREGYFAVEAEIDLHGLSSYEAKRQLLNFLKICVKDGCRCVHIVHGKGYRSQDDYPVLKNHINVWLRQHPEILAFCSAAARDGGAGAVYVLLYSNR